MIVGIIGATGFIGSNFLTLYGQEFEEVRTLIRKTPLKTKAGNISQFQGSIEDSSSLHKFLSGCDVVLHAGFDHSYQCNVTGIKNLIESIKKCNIKKLIYLSSFIVYDLKQGGRSINEESDTSTIHDIYTLEKRKIEHILQEHSHNFHSIILQPSIVYGAGGNWSKVIVENLLNYDFQIPNSGNGHAPIVYIDDLSNAILSSINLNLSEMLSNCETFIISSGEDVNWMEVFSAHNKLLKNYQSLTIEKEGSVKTYLFSNSLSKHLIFSALYSKIGGVLFNKLLRKAKKNIELRKIVNNTENSENVSAIEGLYRSLLFGTGKMDTSKAEHILAFSPQYLLLSGINEMKNKTP